MLDLTIIVIAAGPIWVVSIAEGLILPKRSSDWPCWGTVNSSKGVMDALVFVNTDFVSAPPIDGTAKSVTPNMSMQKVVRAIFERTIAQEFLDYKGAVKENLEGRNAIEF